MKALILCRQITVAFRRQWCQAIISQGATVRERCWMSRGKSTALYSALQLNASR